MSFITFYEWVDRF